MFNNLFRTLAVTLRAAIQPASQSHKVAVDAKGYDLTARELNFFGRGKGGKVSHKRGNAAQLKRASTKANNIRKFN